LLAGVVVASGKSAPIALVGGSFMAASEGLGLIAIAALIFGLYGMVSRLGRQ
jgi:hypothetical protein